MGEKRWALSLPIDGFTLAEHAELAKEAQRLGYRDAWSLEVDGVDCFTPVAVVGAATRLRVGAAIANVYTPGPATLARAADAGGEGRPRGRFSTGCRWTTCAKRWRSCARPPKASAGTRVGSRSRPGSL